MVRDKPNGGFSQTEHPPHYQAGKAKGETVPPGPTSEHSDESRQCYSSRVYKGGEVSRMAGQYGGGTKKSGKWRVCVDYIDLNEACPKDSFPLPRIDQIVDATTGHGIMSFLDALSRYLQIPMHPLEAETTTFIMPHGLYCYNVMLFGLKNAGANYQRMVTRIFRSLIGKSMEVYIDDMLVKSKELLDHTMHLQETFELLQRHDMKLNPLKYAFGVNSGKFIGFMVT